MEGSVVRCVGDIDLATSVQLRDALTTALRDANDVVVVDLSGTQFLDSVGMSVLVRVSRRAANQGVELRVAGAHGLVERVLDVTGLGAVLPIFPSVDEALAGAKSGS